MKKVRSSADMSKRVVSYGTRNVSADPNKKRVIKRNNPTLGKPVEDGDDLMIKF